MTANKLRQKSVKIGCDKANKQEKLWKLYGSKQSAIEAATKKICDRYKQKTILLEKEIEDLRKERSYLQDLCRNNGWCERRLSPYAICSLCGFTRRLESSIGDQAHP